MSTAFRPETSLRELQEPYELALGELRYIWQCGPRIGKERNIYDRMRQCVRRMRLCVNPELIEEFQMRFARRAQKLLSLMHGRNGATVIPMQQHANREERPQIFAQQSANSRSRTDDRTGPTILQIQDYWNQNMRQQEEEKAIRISDALWEQNSRHIPS